MNEADELSIFLQAGKELIVICKGRPAVALAIGIAVGAAAAIGLAGEKLALFAADAEAWARRKFA